MKNDDEWRKRHEAALKAAGERGATYIERDQALQLFAMLHMSIRKFESKNLVVMLLSRQ